MAYSVSGTQIYLQMAKLVNVQQTDWSQVWEVRTDIQASLSHLHADHVRFTAFCVSDLRSSGMLLRSVK
jgi:hypothetical protein